MRAAAAAEPGTDEWVIVRRALDSVHGCDKNPFAASIARFRLLVAAMRAAGAKRLAEAPSFPINVAVGDSLLHGRGAAGVQADLDSLFAQEGGAATFAYATEDVAEFAASVDLLGRGSYHVVVGNPPFLNRLERRTAPDRELGRRWSEESRGALRGYTDVSAVFLHRATAWLRPGGRVALVQPQSLLAARDEVIGSLIENLDEVLDHLGDRDDQLVRLIQTFRTFVSGLKDDREAILGSLDQISELSVETADLVSGIRKPFVEDIKQLRRLTKNINRNKAELDRALQVLPIKLEKVGRTAIYGSFFNFYLCQFTGEITAGGVKLPITYDTSALGKDARCDLG